MARSNTGRTQLAEADRAGMGNTFFVGEGDIKRYERKHDGKKQQCKKEGAAEICNARQSHARKEDWAAQGGKLWAVRISDMVQNASFFIAPNATGGSADESNPARRWMLREVCEGPRDY